MTSRPLFSRCPVDRLQHPLPYPHPDPAPRCAHRLACLLPPFAPSLWRPNSRHTTYTHIRMHMHMHMHVHYTCPALAHFSGTTPARLAMHTQELLEVMKAQTDLLKAKM